MKVSKRSLFPDHLTPLPPLLFPSYFCSLSLGVLLLVDLCFPRIYAPCVLEGNKELSGKTVVVFFCGF